MATLATFLVQFPEFKLTADALVQAHLTAAALEVDVDVWLKLADQGVYYLTAHKLALSPYGNAAQLDASKTYGMGPHGLTTYGAQFDAMVMQVASGWRVC